MVRNMWKQKKKCTQVLEKLPTYTSLVLEISKKGAVRWRTRWWAESDNKECDKGDRSQASLAPLSWAPAYPTKLDEQSSWKEVCEMEGHQKTRPIRVCCLVTTPEPAGSICKGSTVLKLFSQSAMTSRNRASRSLPSNKEYVSIWKTIR